MAWNNTVYCGYCGNQGHNRRGCPAIKEEAKNDPSSYAAHELRRRKERETARGPRRCSYCNTGGHTRRKCDQLDMDMRNAAKVNAEYRLRVKEYMVNSGLGVGTLVRCEGSHGYVSAIRWDNITAESTWDGYKGVAFIFEKLSGSGYSTRHVRIPKAFEEMQPEAMKNVYGWGADRLELVESALSAETVEKQFPKDWSAGFPGIEKLFPKGDSRHAGAGYNIEKVAQAYDIELEIWEEKKVNMDEK